MDQSVVKAGWLYRETGSFFHSWKRLWFELLKNDDLLCYVDGKPEDRKLMYAVCTGIHTGEHECTHKPPDGIPPSCLLMLEMRNVKGHIEQWKMAAETPDDLQVWKIVLTEARANNPNIPQPSPYALQQPYGNTIHSGRAGDMHVSGQQYVVHAPPVMAPTIVVEDDPMMRHYNRRMERYMNARYGTPFISGVGQISHSSMYGGSGYF